MGEASEMVELKQRDTGQENGDRSVEGGEGDEGGAELEDSLL